MWLQELLSTDTHALGQRMSSNRISAADNEYTEGQVMLTGAKLCELIGPRSMAKNAPLGSVQARPGRLPAPVAFIIGRGAKRHFIFTVTRPETGRVAVNMK